MNLIVTPFTLSSINTLAKHGADAFLIGNERFANRLVASFTLDEIKEANQIIKALDKAIIVSLNIIMHDEDIEEVKEYLDYLKELDVNAIIFGDLGIYNLAKEKGMEDKLIYYPETLNTNYYDSIFWNKKGIKGIIISKEISLDDIREISLKKETMLAMIGHGHLNMFHSRRPLISNFFKFNEEEHKEYVNNRNLRLIEELREEVYPVFEDSHGTHIFREKPMESYNETLVLNEYIDCFIIDAIFKDTDYLIETVSNYARILKETNQDFAMECSEKNNETHDKGFLYKKTVYDKY